VRVVVVGCGYWGSKHVRVLNGLEEVSGVAIVDPDMERRNRLQSAFSSVAAFADLEAALPHVDAVVVATPPALHAVVAKKALEAGKDVLVEKPLTTSVADAKDLVELAERENRVLMVGHTFEYNAAVRELRNRIRIGELGRVRYLDGAWLNLGLYQSDVNVVWDLAPHDISISNFLLDSVPSRVSAWGSAHAARSFEDVAQLRLDYDDVDVTAYVRVSWLDPAKVRRITVVGSERMAVYNDLSATERLRIFDRGVEPIDEALELHQMPLNYRYGDIVSPYIPFEEPLAVEDRHFLDCVLNRKLPLTDGRSGAVVVAVLEAASEALRTGFTVTLAAEDRGLEPAPVAAVSSLPTQASAAS
jgi:predicted dehydrogenase